MEARQQPVLRQRPQRQGLGIQLLHSLGRVGLALIAGMPGGDPGGLCDRHVAIDAPRAGPFIQVLGPSVRWPGCRSRSTPSRTPSDLGVFVIFICSIWPMLINTAFGVAGCKREWLNVARTLEVRRCAAPSA